MKITLLASIVLLFAFTSQPLLEASPDQVVDTSGKVLQAGVNYNTLLYIPFSNCRSQQAPGLSKISKSCPLDVVAVDSKKSIATKIDDHLHASKGQWFVITGGVVGNPGRETIGNWFKIEKYNDYYYKLVYCPSVCPSCKHQCRNVGMFKDQNGNQRLALSDPFQLRFFKA
ncbi:hypothetical protein VNO78_21449 [Psophocarpus tetragonolobus]|uniref:Miraculin-like n=1 Tax=Psophocarpus tetragonolobus TaxID=3891 RepID=A0AAN9SCV5_PSOTE